MVCELCNEKEATLHFKHVLDGVVKELHICEGCASKNGLNMNPSEFLTDFLFNTVAAKKKVRAADDRACPSCGMRCSELKKLQRVGCAECYSAFESELKDLVFAMQKGDRHVGKIPAAKRSQAELENLGNALRQAVTTQNFEEAARLRDLIKAIKKQKAADQRKTGGKA